jgi:hypothetical protein
VTVNCSRHDPGLYIAVIGEDTWRVEYVSEGPVRIDVTAIECAIIRSDCMRACAASDWCI